MNDMNELNDIYEKLGRIEGTQKLMLEEMRAGFSRINGSLGEHGQRIDSLEQFRDNQVGAEKQTVKNASVAGGFFGGFVAALLWVVSKIFK